ncbi:MAG TPA: LuxR C-terminal-related transcriptional regulator [Caulobacterales bacterium]|nr:LuxR C-terminal-related transcriptional regulator [Caulobacterales bacterium]
MTNGRRRGRPRSDDALTPGEWRIVDAVRHGMTSREIATRRGISVDAVKYHVANALQKLGLSSRAELRLWNGVARASALAAMERRMNAQTTIGPIGQIARTVTDIAAARTWYADILGLPHLYSFGDLAFFACGGVRLFLAQGEGGADNASVIYFQIEDIHAAQAALEAKGVVFTHAPHMIHRHEDGTEEWMAFFKDNEGRPLALMARTPKPAG